jgi:Abscisic acid G-protein coupled receptor/The Golgi pH Regulator (GPHR) Family N-terminal
MDALLLVPTLIATTYAAPICASQSEFIFSRRKRNLFAIQAVVILAFGLCALSVIECIPSRFLLLFANDHEDRVGLSGRISLAAAYSAVLTGLCACLLVVFPVVVGAHLVPATRGDPDAPIATDHYFYRAPKASSTVGKLLSGTIHAIYASLSFFVRLSLLCWKLVSRRCASSTSRRGSGMGRRDSSSLLPLKGISPQEHQDQLQQAKRVRAVSGKIFGAMCVVAAWWTLLGLLAPFVIQIPEAPSSFSTLEHGSSAIQGFLTLAISRLCAVGLLLSALVNGFGSVSFPFASLTPFYLKPVTTESIAIAEAELARLQSTLEERRYQAANLSSSSSLSISTMSGTNSGNFAAGNRRNGSFSDLGDDFAQRRASISTEVAFLEALIEETKDDVDEMRHSQRVSSRARTPAGRVLSWLGVIMSVVLLVRLLTITISLNWWASISRREFTGVDETTGRSDASPSSRTDVVTMILLWTVGHTRLVSSQQQLNQLSQFISIVLSSFLSVSQVRTFLRTASALNRRLSGLCGACHCHPSSGRRPSPSSSSSSSSGHPPALHSSSDRGQLLASTVYSYGLATLAGCYFLACVVLTKLMLPEPYRRSFSRALLGSAYLSPSAEQGTEYNDDGEAAAAASAAEPSHRHELLLFWVRTGAVNVVFIFAAVASALVLGALFGIQRQNADRYASWAADRPGSGGAGRASASAV